MRVYRQPGHASGTYAHKPIGFVLHGSRSGQPLSVAREFDGTRSYAALPPPIYDEHGNVVGYLGWSATLGEDAYSVHMDAGRWGWHARACSGMRLGVEFAQAHLGDRITDGQVRSFLAWYRAEVVPVWGAFDLSDDHVLATHAEVEHWGETGARDGKTDMAPFGSADADDLRARIRAAL